MYKIYLDDERTPIDNEWVVVRNFVEFKSKIKEIGLKNISHISFDHDLDKTAIDEYYNNVAKNYTIDYSKIEEPTGIDCVKWLIVHFYTLNPKRKKMTHFDKKSYPIKFPKITIHSHNPIGAANILGYINNFFKNEAQDDLCSLERIPYTD
jgi:hypothetical protein